VSWLWVVGCLLGLLSIVLAVQLVTLRRRNAAVLRAERRHAQELGDWAAAHGWDFHEGAAGAAWLKRFAHLTGFRVDYVVAGSAQAPRVTAADCHYVTPTVMESTPDVDGGTVPLHISLEYRLAVYVAHLPGDWPEAAVIERDDSPGSTWRQSKIAEDVTGPEFTRRFVVVASDPQAAGALFTPALIDAHLHDRVPPWSLRDGELVIVGPGRLGPQTIMPAVEKLRRLAVLLGYRG
jgi:hypothetical protein